MTKRLKHFLFALAMSLLASVQATAQSSDCVEQMSDLVEIYEEFNRTFPHSDYVTLRQSEVCYWINREMRPDYDYVGAMQRLKPVIDRLKALPCQQPAYVNEGAPAEGILFSCRPSFRDESQYNYVELVFNRNKVHFYYQSKSKAAPADPQPNPQIVKALDELWQTFCSRPGVVTSDIVFDGPTYQYQLVTFNNPQQIRQHAEGKIYTIQNCTPADWQRVFDQISGYALKHRVQVAWNDVYRDHEAVEIWIDRESTIPIVFGAAYHDHTLKLLRLEGTAGYNIVLPRIWSEDSPIFDPKKNKDYIKR